MCLAQPSDSSEGRAVRLVGIAQLCSIMPLFWQRHKNTAHPPDKGDPCLHATVLTGSENLEAGKCKAEGAALFYESSFLCDSRGCIVHSKWSFYGRVPRVVPQCLLSSVLGGISNCGCVKLFMNYHLVVSFLSQ